MNEKRFPFLLPRNVIKCTVLFSHVNQRFARRSGFKYLRCLHGNRTDLKNVKPSWSNRCRLVYGAVLNGPDGATVAVMRQWADNNNDVSDTTDTPPRIVTRSRRRPCVHVSACNYLYTPRRTTVVLLSLCGVRLSAVIIVVTCTVFPNSFTAKRTRRPQTKQTVRCPNGTVLSITAKRNVASRKRCAERPTGPALYNDDRSSRAPRGMCVHGTRYAHIHIYLYVYSYGR